MFRCEISGDQNDTCKKAAPGAAFRRHLMGGGGQNMKPIVAWITIVLISIVRKIDCNRRKKKAPQMRGLDYLERVMRIELTTLTLAT